MMKRILIVDDDQDIVKLVEDRLEDNNYEVICANDGDDGINKAKQQQPDLIIMDIIMPGMSGGDAVRLLKADGQTKNIPIIFLTAAVADISKGQEIKTVNVDGQFLPAIAKPFNPSELLFEIKKLIGGK